MTSTKRTVTKIISMFLAVLVLVSSLSVANFVFAAEYPTGYPNTHVNTGDQLKDIIAIAKTQVGYQEGYNDATKYGAWMADETGYDIYANTAWCAMFVNWCADQAGMTRGVIPFTASCDAMKAGFSSSQIHTYADGYTPKPGDIAFFSNYSSTDTVNMGHVGLVIGVDAASGTIDIIEGNCSASVKRLTRPIFGYSSGQYITLYGSPNYKSVSTVPVTGVSMSLSSLALDIDDRFTLTASVNPSNASNKSVTWSSSDSTVASVSSSGVVTAKKAGTATITAKTSDGGYKATCRVTVNQAKPVLKSIEIASKPSKTIYNQYETFSSSGMKINAVYSDGSKKDVTSLCTLTGNGTSQTGTKTVTVRYEENSVICKANFNITVNEKIVLKSIRVDEIPSKTTYFQYEAFSSDGMKITAVYSNGTTKDVTSSCTFTGHGTSVVGTKTVTVRFEENGVICKTTFDFTVKAKLKTLTISSKPTVTEYGIGSELSLDGMQVIAGYSDSSVKTVTSLCSVSGFDSSKAGTKTVKLSYTENGITLTTSFTVKVIDTSTVEPEPEKAKLKNIYVTQKPSKTIYFQWELFNSDGMTVTATYTDGTKKDVTSQSTLTGIGTSIVGVRTVTVRYEEEGVIAKTTFSLVVKAKLKTLEIESMPNKTVYEVGEEFSSDGLKVVAGYSDGSSKDVTSTCSIKGFDSTEVGTCTVKVSYAQSDVVLTTKFTVEIKEKTAVQDPTEVRVKSIEITSLPNKTTYISGELFVRDGLKVVASFSDGSQNDITKNIRTSGYTSEVGQKTMTVYYTYKDVTVSATFGITIKPKIVQVVLEKKPNKLTYFEGDTFDKTGMVLKATLSDGSVEDFTSLCEVKGFDSSRLGKQTLTVVCSYGTVTAEKTFSVTIKPAVVKIKADADCFQKKSVSMFDDDFKVVAVYTDGTQADVTNKVSVDYKNAFGIRTVKVSYVSNGKTFTDKFLIFVY